MYDLMVAGLLCFGASVLLTDSGWRVYAALGVFYVFLVLGTSISLEKTQLERVIAKADDLTQSYAREQQALAKNVLLLSTQQVAMSQRMEREILDIVERQAPAAIPDAVRSVAQSVTQLGASERLVDVTRAIASSEKVMAEIRAEFDLLPEAFERNSVLHAHAYWAIEDVLGISSTLPRTFPLWSEPKNAPAEIKS